MSLVPKLLLGSGWIGSSSFVRCSPSGSLAGAVPKQELGNEVETRLESGSNLGEPQESLRSQAGPASRVA